MGDLPKVTGSADFNVHIECPHCGEDISLITDNGGGYDYDEVVSGAFFDNDVRGGWENLDIEMTCHHCEREFIFDEIEY